MKRDKNSLEAGYSGTCELALGRLRQGHHKCETSLSKIVRSCLTKLLSELNGVHKLLSKAGKWHTVLSGVLLFFSRHWSGFSCGRSYFNQ